MADWNVHKASLPPLPGRVSSKGIDAKTGNPSWFPGRSDLLSPNWRWVALSGCGALMLLGMLFLIALGGGFGAAPSSYQINSQQNATMLDGLQMLVAAGKEEQDAYRSQQAAEQQYRLSQNVLQYQQQQRDMEDRRTTGIILDQMSAGERQDAANRRFIEQNGMPQRNP